MADEDPLEISENIGFRIGFYAALLFAILFPYFCHPKNLAAPIAYFSGAGIIAILYIMSFCKHCRLMTTEVDALHNRAFETVKASGYNTCCSPLWLVRLFAKHHMILISVGLLEGGIAYFYIVSDFWYWYDMVSATMWELLTQLVLFAWPLFSTYAFTKRPPYWVRPAAGSDLLMLFTSRSHS